MILSGGGGVGNGGGGAGCKFPFTAAQWQELEQQALIYKYMVSGVPIPPDLLFSVKRSFLDLTSTSPHLGWSCFQMGLGLGMRKIDPEPGRCRRTDGKKWRCSKEAFQESKYCEKHMHRGKNRSRKLVEQPQQQLHLQQVLTTPSSMVKVTKHYSSSLSSSVTSDPHNNSNQLYPILPSYYGNIHPYHHSTQFGLHSGVDRRVADEDGHSLMNGCSWGLTPLKMSCANGERMISSTKEHHHQQEYPPYFQFQGFEDYESTRTCVDDNVVDDYDEHGRTRREKTVYRFLEECPPDSNIKDSSASCSLLNLDDNKSSNGSSSSTTQLSISIPTSATTSTTSHHHQLFPMFNSSNF